jgi:uncharacterized HAD superfamily protein
MIIGIDIDNTISHSTEMILHYAKIFGQQQGLNTVDNPNGYYLEDALGWSSEAVREFFDLYLATIYREVRPKEQAREVIAQLHERHQVMLITSRNYQYPGVEMVTRKWLQENGIIYDKLILNPSSNIHYFDKLSVCMQNGVDLMIEDHHDLARELSQFMPVILFDYPYNQHVQAENVFRVNNWSEVCPLVDRLAQTYSISKPIA